MTTATIASYALPVELLTVQVNGRKIAYAEAGDPDGVPVVHLHGAGVSRLEVLLFDAEARAAGVRLIGPDRPGCGYSDPNPDFTVLQYADDVIGLADALAIDRFVVSGYSNGGMYAMAVASAHPHRVRGVVAINTTTPTADPAVRRHLGTSGKILYGLMSRMPRLTAALTAMGSPRLPADGSLPKASRFARFVGMKMGLEPKLIDLGVRAGAETRRQPASGYTLHELRLATGPWGLDHTAVAPRVELFSGDDDAGYRYARKWADALPDGELTVLAGDHGAQLKPAARSQIVAAMARLGAAASQR